MKRPPAATLRPWRSPLILPVLVVLLLAPVLLVRPAAVHACDICAVYTATELQESRTGLRLGLAQQLSRFTTLQFEGDEAPNPYRERMTSAITQMVAGYRLAPRLGLQATLPWIHRDYRRRHAGAIDNGNEHGLGDFSLLASWAALTHTDENSVARLTLIGGVKLPTGSSDRLAEEVPAPLDPNDVRDKLNGQWGVRRHGAPVARPQAHLGPGPAEYSGIHGHDLSLGTGSIDPIFGVQGLWTWRRAVVSGNVQYVLRTRGSYGYEYADELTAGLNPGVFAVVAHDHSLSLHLASTLERKGKDNLDGQTLADTALTALYLGPGLHFTRGSALSLDFTADIPVLLDNSSLQIVPDFRLRAGFVWRF